MLIGENKACEETARAVVEAMGGSVSYLEAGNGYEAFSEQLLPEALLKAKDCENHWIFVVGKGKDFFWPEYVESLNTLLDDNKCYDLKGKRIPLPASARIVVISETAKCMTPATVSRCGVINMNA
jgi:hypothetical protein